MREQMQTRLEALKKELERGGGVLERVELQRTYLQQTTLRIVGAIQVLEELLAEAQPAHRDETSPGATQTTLHKTMRSMVNKKICTR
jgi:hypothetical protein